MKKLRYIQAEEVAEIVCDRCLKCFGRNDPNYHEIQSLEFVGGYGSIFGDGMEVAIDLCPACLQETLGSWLRVQPGPWLRSVNDSESLRLCGLDQDAGAGGSEKTQ